MLTIFILALLIAGVSACLAVSYATGKRGALERWLANVSMLMALAVAAQALFVLQGAA